MFGLGVLVGRESRPVLFETRPFQERLGQMVSELAAKTPEKKKIDLKLYDVLDKPIYHPVKGKTEDPGEIIPGPEIEETASITPAPNNPQPEEIPVKRSKKLVTWHQAGQGAGSDAAPAPAHDAASAPSARDGAYTIQVASYKDLNDALAQMVLLDKKGIASYRVSVKINQETWYRIRTGAFADYKAASARLSQLAGAGVNGMVIKKE